MPTCPSDIPMPARHRPDIPMPAGLSDIPMPAGPPDIPMPDGRSGASVPVSADPWAEKLVTVKLSIIPASSCSSLWQCMR